MKTLDITILLLAAGASSRMGKPKQLLEWQGTELINHQVRKAAGTRARGVVVVLGAHAEAVREVLQPAPDVDLVENPDWQQGLGRSISTGMHFVRQNFPATKGVLVMLCDQPLIDREFLDDMINAFSAGATEIIATRYAAHPGVPALFGQRFFKQLELLQDEGGARELLAGEGEKVTYMDPGGRTADIDTPEDYEKVKNVYKLGSN